MYIEKNDQKKIENIKWHEYTPANCSKSNYRKVISIYLLRWIRKNIQQIHAVWRNKYFSKAITINIHCSRLPYNRTIVIFCDCQVCEIFLGLINLFHISDFLWLCWFARPNKNSAAGGSRYFRHFCCLKLLLVSYQTTLISNIRRPFLVIFILKASPPPPPPPSTFPPTCSRMTK